MEGGGTTCERFYWSHPDGERVRFFGPPSWTHILLMASAPGGLLRETWPVRPWTDGYRHSSHGVSDVRAGARRISRGEPPTPGVVVRVAPYTSPRGTSAEAGGQTCCEIVVPHPSRGAHIVRGGLRRVLA